MRFVTGLIAAAASGVLVLATAETFAQGRVAGGGSGGGGGHGGGHGGFAGPAQQVIGPGAFGPGQGPVGARGFFGGGFQRHQPVIGPLGGGGGYYGGYDGADGYVAPGGNAAVYNFNYQDYRRNDGGFYGGGGVFYADDGYSRLYARRSYSDGPPEYGPSPAYVPAQHIFYLEGTKDNRVGPAPRR